MGNAMEGSARGADAAEGWLGDERRNNGAGEETRARESEREEKKRGAAFLTLRRNSRDARASRGGGGAAIHGGSELQSSNGGARVWSGKGGGGLRRKAKNTGEAINRGGWGSLECAPRQGAGRRAAAGLPESASPTGRKTTPTGGARLSAAEGRGRRSRPSCSLGREEGSGPAVEKIWAAKKRRKKEGLGRLG